MKRLKITEGIYNQSHRNTNPLLTLILNGFEFFRFLENIVIIRSHNSEKQLSVLSNIRELLVISEHVVHSIDFMLMASKSIFCIYHKKSLHDNKHLHNVCEDWSLIVSLLLIFKTKHHRTIVISITAGYVNSCYNSRLHRFMLLKIQFVRYQVKRIQ